MSLLKKIFKGNTLYYRGCLTRTAAREIGSNYFILLKKAGIDFIDLHDDEICCGSPAISSGHKKEAKELAEKNFKFFKSRGVDRIIVSCPGCYRVFAKEYPNLVPGWDIKVEHIAQTLNEAIKQGKLKAEDFPKMVTYHDPCHLGRLGGIYDEPREIIKATGAKITEMKLSKKDSFCCGGGGGLNSNYHGLSNSIANERLEIAKSTGSKCLITTCPMCYLHMKNNSKPKGLEVKELSEILRGEGK
jgi:heterodisulfide reductase subunit D